MGVRRWPQAVCSRSVSQRWMGCGTVDLLRFCQGLTGAGRSQTSPAPGGRGLGPGGARRRVQRGRRTGIAAPVAAPRPVGGVGSRGRLARPPWRGPAATRRVSASLSRKIVQCAQETLHAWVGEPRDHWGAETRRRRQGRCPPPPRHAPRPPRPHRQSCTPRARYEHLLWPPWCGRQPFPSLYTPPSARGSPTVRCANGVSAREGRLP